FTLAVVDWSAQPDFGSIGDRHHNGRFGCLESEQVETALGSCYFGGRDFLDHANSVIWIDYFLAYFKAHRYLLVTSRTEMYPRGLGTSRGTAPSAKDVKLEFLITEP